MKIRNGFVSNSSSSSFLIAKETEEANFVIPLSTMSFDVFKKIETAEELVAYYDTRYWGSSVPWEEDELVLAMFCEVIKAIRKGKIIFEIDIDNWGEEYNFIKDEAFQDVNKFKILTVGGY